MAKNYLKNACLACHRPSKNTCSKCGHFICDKHSYFYVDGNNRSITKNSPKYCEKCYVEVYGSDK